jgi:putative flippase GtrA
VKTLLGQLVRDERIRFLLVGGVNTIVGYLLFALFEVTIGRVVGYLVSLYLSYAIAVLLAFVLHRRFTFRVAGTGNVLVDLARFAGVYVVALAVNTVALPALVELARLPPLLAQAIVVVFTTVLSYVGHKLFSFRRRPRTEQAVGAADDA